MRTSLLRKTCMSKTDIIFCFAVDGGFSAWNKSQPCQFLSASSQCGPGTQLVTRLCNNPAPRNGGLPCPKDGFNKSQSCHVSCPQPPTRRESYIYNDQQSFMVIIGRSQFSADRSMCIFFLIFIDHLEEYPNQLKHQENKNLSSHTMPLDPVKSFSSLMETGFINKETKYSF